MPLHFRFPQLRIFALSAVLGLLPSAAALAAEQAYDPLTLPEGTKSVTQDFTVDDTARKREIPLRVYLPVGPNVDVKRPAPVVLFSHGLGGSRENNPYLGNHWAARGYVCVFLQHAGSDSAVWQGKPLTERMDALREAAGLQNFMLRVEDVPAVLDQLAKWNAASDHPLAGRLDLQHVGMSGHSFGAVTTQAVSGQKFVRGAKSFTEPRIKAATMFSPSSPRGGDPQAAFGEVRIPWLLMTGTNDVAAIGNIDVESRLAVFSALPAGEKYELVLDGAEHSAFSQRGLPGDRHKRNPNHHRVILALSTAFWDAYLRGDSAAKQWLDGDGPQAVLEKTDRWRKK